MKTLAKKVAMFSPGIEPGTFRMLGGCDNHYTTKTSYTCSDEILTVKLSLNMITLGKNISSSTFLRFNTMNKVSRNGRYGVSWSQVGTLQAF